MIRKKLNKIRKIFIDGKVMIGRTTGYINLASAGLILYLFFSDLKEKGYVDFDLGNKLPIIYILTFMLLIFVGYLEVRYFKGIHEEQKIKRTYDPLFMEIYYKINEMYENEKVNEVHE